MIILACDILRGPGGKQGAVKGLNSTDGAPASWGNIMGVIYHGSLSYYWGTGLFRGMDSGGER